MRINCLWFLKKGNLDSNLAAVLVFYCCEETPWPQQFLKGKRLTGSCYSFRGSVHSRGREHGDTQTWYWRGS